MTVIFDICLLILLCMNKSLRYFPRSVDQLHLCLIYKYFLSENWFIGFRSTNLVAINFRTKLVVQIIIGDFCATVSHMATKSESLSQLWKNGKSPLLDSWPLYNDPSSVAIILMSYMFFVLYLGPKLMENRKPFNLRHVIVLYNAVQVFFNCYMLKRSMVEPTFWKYLFSFGCAQVSPQEEHHYDTLICVAFWNMTVNKIMDLLDTVFFVLCKKQNHITVLHVQHHVLTVAILWLGGKYFTGQEFTATFVCNTIVHVIMYCYYFIAALGPAYKKYLWWKKYLTKIQIGQFVIIILYMLASIWLSCGYDQRIIWLLIGNVSLNLILFLNFYFKTYDSKKMLQQKMATCGSLQFNNSSTADQQRNVESDVNVNSKKEM